MDWSIVDRHGRLSIISPPSQLIIALINAVVPCSDPSHDGACSQVRRAQGGLGCGAHHPLAPEDRRHVVQQGRARVAVPVHAAGLD